MISQTAEYALRAVVCLADQSAPKTTAKIARETRVPAGYLAKVMQGLSRRGLVHAQRGLHGGFLLTASADKLTVLDVVSAVDPIRRYSECPLGKHGKVLCRLHQKLDDAAKRIEKDLAETTIAELIFVSSGDPTCSFPELNTPSL